MGIIKMYNSRFPGKLESRWLGEKLQMTLNGMFFILKVLEKAVLNFS